MAVFLNIRTVDMALRGRGEQGRGIVTMFLEVMLQLVDITLLLEDMSLLLEMSLLEKMSLLLERSLLLLWAVAEFVASAGEASLKHSTF